jgi:hypothetical protein
MTAPALSLPRRSAVPAWALVGLIAGGVGAITALAPIAGLAVVGLGLFAILLMLPPVVAIVATPVAAVLYRFVSPAASGVVGLVPDILVAAVLVRAALAWVASPSKPSEGNARSRRYLRLALGALLVVCVASALLNGDSLTALLVSLRQFGRFPLWCLAVLSLGLAARHRSHVVAAVVAVAFVQVPLAYYQFTGHAPAVPASYHLERFDLVSGSFGIGGSGVLTVFLLLVFVLWCTLALRRVIRPWVWLVGSAMLILPMAWGSAASFVLLVPLSLVAVVSNLVLSRRIRLPLAGLVGGALLVGVAVWAAQSFAFAPGFGRGQIAASQLLSDRYLSEYVSRNANAGNSRLGFMLFALRTDARGGAGGILLGQGPAAAVIGMSKGASVPASLTEFFSKAPHVAYSAQRMLLGYGFLGLLMAMVLPLAPLIGAARRPGPDPAPGADGVWLAMPVVAFLYLLTGVYSAPWTEPGVAAAYWALVAVAVLGRRPVDGIGA